MSSSPIIALYGDSTTEGVTYSAPAGGDGYYTTANSEPASLQKVFPGVVVENHGHAGATAFDALMGYKGAPNWWQEMAASQAKVVVLNFGLNDSWKISPEWYATCLGALIDIAHNAGKTVVVETPNPSTTWWMTDGVARTAALAKTIAEAHGAAVVDQWSDIKRYMPDWQARLSDGVHPTDSMYQVKADNTAAVLAPLLPGTIPDGYAAVGTGDFQGNGRVDLLLRDESTGSVAQLRPDNAMTFADIGWAPPDWQITGTSDVNHDGTTDILFRDPASGSFSYFQMHDGRATWVPLGWDWQP